MLRSPNLEKFLSLKWFLEPIKYLLLFLSSLAIVFTLIKASNLHWDFSPNGFHKFIALYSDYSILFAATFIIINVQLILRQQTITENENKKKWQVEETNASLIQCQIFLNDIQLVYRDFLKTGIYDGMTIEWPGLTDITREGLKATYPRANEKFQKMDKNIFYQSMVLLHKLDALASIFIHGFADINTGKKAIGYLYCKQIAFLMGIIAYSRVDQELFQNILQLYDIWKDENSATSLILYD